RSRCLFPHSMRGVFAAKYPAERRFSIRASRREQDLAVGGNRQPGEILHGRYRGTVEGLPPPVSRARDAKNTSSPDRVDIVEAFAGAGVDRIRIGWVHRQTADRQVFHEVVDGRKTHSGIVAPPDSSSHATGPDAVWMG